MLHVIREAVYLYKDYPDAFARLRQRAMEQDFSWNRSAGEYLKIYAAVTGISGEPEQTAQTSDTKTYDASNTADVPQVPGTAAKKKTAPRKVAAKKPAEKTAKPAKKPAAKKAAADGKKTAKTTKPKQKGAAKTTAK